VFDYLVYIYMGTRARIHTYVYDIIMVECSFCSAVFRLGWVRVFFFKFIFTIVLFGDFFPPPPPRPPPPRRAKLFAS